MSIEKEIKKKTEKFGKNLINVNKFPFTKVCSVSAKKHTIARYKKLPGTGMFEKTEVSTVTISFFDPRVVRGCLFCS